VYLTKIIINLLLGGDLVHFFAFFPLSVRDGNTDVRTVFSLSVFRGETRLTVVADVRNFSVSASRR